MKNFFEQQEVARRNTGKLLALFALAVAGIAASTYLITIVVGKILKLKYARPDPQALPEGFWAFWDPQFFLINFIVVTALIGVACLVRISSLRKGGASVALMLGGRFMNRGVADDREKRLLNIVEEMAIASGVPMPEVFVLEDQPGINAFAAGYSADDAAITVTAGALDHLSRDELQGVIAHEFSHILSGDMRLNIRLMGVLYGILVMAVMGKGILQGMGHMRISRGGGKGGGGIIVVILVVALMLMAIGYLGLFFGRSIKAAVSRQREYLADAAAVQFTRNPAGLAGALKKIGGASQGSLIHDPKAEEASHLFFGQGVKLNFFSGILATHPPLVDRIKRLEPNFDGEFPQVKAAPVRDEAASSEWLSQLAAQTDAAASGDAEAAGAAEPVAAFSAGDEVGRPMALDLLFGARLLARIPAPLREATESGFSACALVYAALLDDDIAVAEKQYGIIGQFAGQTFLQETARLEDSVRALDRELMLPLAHLTLPMLRRMTEAQLAAFVNTVELLVLADDYTSVFEFALTHTLLRRLQKRNLGRRRRKADNAKTFLPDARVLLSCLARNGSDNEAVIEAAYLDAMRTLFKKGAEPPALLPPERCVMPELGRALDRLELQIGDMRKVLLDACARCVLFDETVILEEAELLRVVADALNCPLPPRLSERMTSR